MNKILDLIFNVQILIGVAFMVFIAITVEQPICRLGPEWTKAKDGYFMLPLVEESSKLAEPGLLKLPPIMHALICSFGYFFPHLLAFVGVGVVSKWNWIRTLGLIISSICFFCAVLPIMTQLIVGLERTDYPIPHLVPWFQNNFLHLFTPLLILGKLILMEEKPVPRVYGRKRD